VVLGYIFMKNRLIFEILFLSIFSALIILFNEYLQNRAASKMEIFYFYSPDCLNCKEIKPFIESLKDELQKKNARFVELNVKEYDRWSPLYRILSEKIVQKLNTNFLPIPTTSVRQRGRFYTFIGKDEIINHLNDFLYDRGRIKRISAKLERQEFKIQGCLSCHRSKNIPFPSTFNCTFCCHRVKTKE